MDARPTICPTSLIPCAAHVPPPRPKDKRIPLGVMVSCRRLFCDRLCGRSLSRSPNRGRKSCLNTRYWLRVLLCWGFSWVALPPSRTSTLALRDVPAVATPCQPQKMVIAARWRRRLLCVRVVKAVALVHCSASTVTERAAMGRSSATYVTGAAGRSVSTATELGNDRLVQPSEV